MAGSALATLKSLFSTVAPLHEALGVPLASPQRQTGDLELLRTAVACYDPSSWSALSNGAEERPEVAGVDMAKVRSVELGEDSCERGVYADRSLVRPRCGAHRTGPRRGPRVAWRIEPRTAPRPLRRQCGLSRPHDLVLVGSTPSEVRRTLEHCG